MKKYNISFLDITIFCWFIFLMIYGFTGHLSSIQGAFGWLVGLIYFTGVKYLYYYQKQIDKCIEEERKFYKEAIELYKDTIEIYKK